MQFRVGSFHNGSVQSRRIMCGLKKLIAKIQIPLLKVKPTFVSRTMSTVMTAHTPFLLRGRRKPGAKHNNPAIKAARPAFTGNVTGLLNRSISLSFIMGHIKTFQMMDSVGSLAFRVSLCLRSERVRA